ncbi:MAG: YgiQ family radical SAM protein [Bacteroidia bacterium]|nr:YgiQ family radical SAM protein [Bacteroidia bacterium]
MNRWLPITKKETEQLGWTEVDVILISGDAYVDHPSFGAAVIGRVLERAGLKVAIIPQPQWKDDLRDFKKFGRPRLFFAITSGNMDSMVNHYTAHIRKRSDDAYTPGGSAGFRPDYAVTVYSNIVKTLYPDVPVIIGGIEASLRRLAHYDYWSNSLKPSVLIDSKADILVYGMAEKPMIEIARKLKEGAKFSDLKNIPQIAYIEDNIIENANNIVIASYEKCLSNKDSFGEAFKSIEIESNKFQAQVIVQPHQHRFVVVNPPYQPVTTKELDNYYDLPFTRLPHPKYAKRGAISAYEMIKYSVTIHRGCFGGCSFCSLAIHQGKFISNRSEKSIINEVENIVKEPEFKGQLSDLGGPSANMYKLAGEDFEICKKCLRPSCIFPSVCNNLSIDPSAMLQLYRKVRAISGIKKAAIGSGIRYDINLDKKSRFRKLNLEYLTEVIKYHVSGRLKVAPEHSVPHVLKLMRKPSFEYYAEMKDFFERTNRENKINQQIIPYYISSHPGCSLEDMAELALANKQTSTQPEQIQDFTPTPMTLASVMYYTGKDPYTGEKVFVSKLMDEKRLQKSFFFYYKPEFKHIIASALYKTGRKDLIAKLGLKK